MNCKEDREAFYGLAVYGDQVMRKRKLLNNEHLI